MMSLKQQRRMAAKARRRHYLAMRDSLLSLRPGTFEHMCAWQAYRMREQFVRPLYQERMSFEPPPGRRAGLSARAALDSVARVIDAQAYQAAEDALVYGVGVMSTAQVLLEQGKATWGPRS